MIDIELVARVCHEANRALQIEAGDDVVSPQWEYAPQWQKDSAYEGIKKALEGATPEQLHESWCDHKVADGWRYGATKNPIKKTHPCLVPYDELPMSQQIKDKVFESIVFAFKEAGFTA